MLRNKNPFRPLDKISLGPLGQLLDIINVLLKAASSITNPGSSHKDDKIKQSEFNKYLYTFFYSLEMILCLVFPISLFLLLVIPSVHLRLIKLDDNWDI